MIIKLKDTQYFQELLNAADEFVNISNKLSKKFSIETPDSFVLSFFSLSQQLESFKEEGTAGSMTNSNSIANLRTIICSCVKQITYFQNYLSSESYKNAAFAKVVAQCNKQLRELGSKFLAIETGISEIAVAKSGNSTFHQVRHQITSNAVNTAMQQQRSTTTEIVHGSVHNGLFGAQTTAQPQAQTITCPISRKI